MFRIAYLSFADLDLGFSLISFNVGNNTFLHTVVNKFALFSFAGRYREGLLLVFEYKFKKRYKPRL